jgi:hypothetical protein
MGLTKQKQYIVIILSIISVLLGIYLYRFINYLVENKYVVEYFSANITPESKNTSHTVSLPLTTTYSCTNFCSPTSRCAITGQQCFTDIDCYGCQPYVPPLKSSADCIPGDDDAGKLTFTQTPQYSPLTTDMGTQAKIITNNIYAKPPQPNFGVNVWRTAYNESDKLFNERYKPHNLPFMPNYDERYSMLGEFKEDGPLPSNAYIPLNSN